MARNSRGNTGFHCILLVVGVLRSLASECEGDNCKNVISMPLLDKMKATLKADLDVTNMNNHLKAYIEQQTQKGVGTAMKDDMRQLIDNKLKEINAKIESTILEELKRIGVTYVRWGRKGCPDGAELVYTGRKTCYKDWNAEYNGYLMASHNKYKRTDYACIDVNAEQFDNKSAYNEDGALFYPIRTSCGSLRCPPYREDADVLCVLCTK
ncbi:unnamed protein product [Mytilus coruscus]|uniref:Uncharacterized protein n=1 Tax=Mytilus coruscus TaxID=42192 RepID=A0A6J8AJ37_MYTCO|nr:unnamed protein product [Mytilus coruscus]